MIYFSDPQARASGFLLSVLTSGFLDVVSSNREIPEVKHGKLTTKLVILKLWSYLLLFTKSSNTSKCSFLKPRFYTFIHERRRMNHAYSISLEPESSNFVLNCV